MNEGYGERAVPEDFLAGRKAEFQDLPRRPNVAEGLAKGGAAGSGLAALNAGFHPDDEILPFEVMAAPGLQYKRMNS